MTGNFADCLVSCGGSTVQLHREIICLRSKYFRAALAGGFMVCYSPYLVSATEGGSIVLAKQG